MSRTGRTEYQLLLMKAFDRGRNVKFLGNNFGCVLSKLSNSIVSHFVITMYSVYGEINVMMMWMISIADIYHSTFDWPTSASVASRLEETVGTSEKEMVERLVAYHRNIVGVRSFYQHIVKEINADQPKSDVFSQGLSQPSLHNRMINANFSTSVFCWVKSNQPANVVRSDQSRSDILFMTKTVNKGNISWT